jgi:hypothetical protein
VCTSSCGNSGGCSNAPGAWWVAAFVAAADMSIEPIDQMRDVTSLRCQIFRSGPEHTWEIEDGIGTDHGLARSCGYD